MNKHDKREKQLIIGFSILRIWMCFEVILCHFMVWSDNLSFPLNILKSFSDLAVPVFMLLAFLLTDINKVSCDNNKIKKRFYRLLIPQLVWTIIYYIIYYIMDRSLNTNLQNGISDFFFQLFLGHSINQTLWFQVNLIWLTILFVIIFKKFNKTKAIKITIFIGLLGLFLEYTNINGMIFNYINIPNINKDYIIYPIGRFIEMLPYASLGILMNQYKIFNKIKKYKDKIIVIASLILICLPIEENIFILPLGYGYQGIYKIIICLSLVILFYYLSINKFNNIINNIAKYTMGIYFTHRLIATIIYNTNLYILFKMKHNFLYDSIMIYIFSFIFVYLISKVPIKYIKNSVI